VPDAKEEGRRNVKRFILLWVATLSIAGSAPLWASSDLSQAARAKIEDDLYRKLTPMVGVFDYVAFKLDRDGTVTLLGQVHDAGVKQRAEVDAKKAEGVKQVRNQIEVLPPSSSDEGIRRSLYQAIYGQTGFSRYKQQPVPPIHIVVKNGSVVLEGMVANQQEYAQVNSAVKSVSGVGSVKNNLRIEQRG
jgi:hyperosmotically inducible periplasmic protein